MVLGLITGPRIIVPICFLQVGANYSDHWSDLGGASHHHQLTDIVLALVLLNMQKVFSAGCF